MLLQPYFFVYARQQKEVRDPFTLPQQVVKKSEENRLRLVGIMTYQDSFGAIITKKDRCVVVIQGEQAFGYVVQSINQQEVTLIKNAKTKKLFFED